MMFPDPLSSDGLTYDPYCPSSFYDNNNNNNNFTYSQLYSFHCFVTFITTVMPYHFNKYIENRFGHRVSTRVCT